LPGCQWRDRWAIGRDNRHRGPPASGFRNYCRERGEVRQALLHHDLGSRLDFGLIWDRCAWCDHLPGDGSAMKTTDIIITSRASKATYFDAGGVLRTA